MKAMEDHKVMYDGTIRNAEESIVDFSYGGDGMDASSVERVSLSVLTESITSLAKRLTEWEFENMIEWRTSIMKCKQTPGVEFDNRVLLPFNPKRITFETMDDDICSPDDLEILIQQTVDLLTTKNQKVAFVDSFNRGALVDKGIGTKSAQEAFEKIVNCQYLCAVNPGEMVGSIAAQSIGEPCTQVTLLKYVSPLHPSFVLCFVRPLCVSPLVCVADDVEHLSFCRCVLKECHSWYSAFEGALGPDQINQNAV